MMSVNAGSELFFLIHKKIHLSYVTDSVKIEDTNIPSANSLDLSSGGSRFESRSRHLLS
jgi:hypothetical protein